MFLYPLVIDTVAVTDPGSYGFVIEDSGGTKTIAGVEIVNGDTVRISVTADLDSNPFVSYAYYGVGGQGGGPITGARGCIRDSDPTIGLHGAELPNWAVAFRKSIPYLKS